MDESSISCSSNDSIVDENSDNLCNANNCLHIHQNVCASVHPDCRNCMHRQKIYSSDDGTKKCINNGDKSPKLVSLAVQTENKAAYQSIGLQANICEVSIYINF